MPFDKTRAATGSDHSVCVDSQGIVWSFGSNSDGQLGLGVEEAGDIQRVKAQTHLYCAPQQIPTLHCIATVACGYRFTVCVDNRGQSWAFGLNDHGQLGIDSNLHHTNIPQPVLGIPEIQYVSCGIRHTMFLTVEGELWSVGDNFDGQLGLPATKENRIIRPQKVPGNQGIIVDVSCGTDFTMLVNMTGYVFACGNNDYKRLGIPLKGFKKIFSFTKIPNLKRIEKIACGSRQILFLHRNGKVSSIIPSNCHKDTRQTSFTDLPPIKKIYCAGFKALLVDRDNKLLIVDARTKTVIDFNLKVSITARGLGEHIIVKDVEGVFWCYGNNTSGQLGIGDQCSKFQIFECIENSDILGHHASRVKSARTAL